MLSIISCLEYDKYPSKENLFLIPHFLVPPNPPSHELSLEDFQSVDSLIQKTIKKLEKANTHPFFTNAIIPFRNPIEFGNTMASGADNDACAIMPGGEYDGKKKLKTEGKS